MIDERRRLRDEEFQCERDYEHVQRQLLESRNEIRVWRRKYARRRDTEDENAVNASETQDERAEARLAERVEKLAIGQRWAAGGWRNWPGRPARGKTARASSS